MNEDLFELRPEGFQLNEMQRVLYGKVNGINALIEPYKTPDSHLISIQVDLEDEEKREKLLDFVHSLEDMYSFVTYTNWNQASSVLVKVKADKEEDRRNLLFVISDITGKCDELGLHSCCEFCKGRGNLFYMEFNGDRKQICEECGDKLTQALKKQEKAAKENVFLGIIGGLLGAVIGSLLWLLLDQIGFIAGIAGYAIVYCSFRGYEMFGHRVSRKGVVICVVICVLMILGVDLFSFGLDIYKEFHSTYSITFGDALASIPYFLTESEVLRSIGFNLLIGYLLAVVGSYSFIGNVWNMVSQPQERKKMIRL